MTTFWIFWILIISTFFSVIHTFPQSYEHKYVRIHIPVYKHTRHHTRTVVKKVPVPVPVPVPVHHKEERNLYKWPAKSYHQESYFE